MTAMPEAPFSELINKPKDTVAKLASTPKQKLRLKRRDSADLLLTTVERAEQDGEVLSATTRIFVALIAKDAAARTLLTEVIPEAFPWVRFLPKQDVQQFLVELVETLRAAEDLDNLAPVAQLIVEWKHTAEVHSDPELKRALTHDLGDLGSLLPPEATTE
ncbi:hypothetical protein [Kutzneria sp. NPDC052558]|uniref:hypothetical protein n=1 Tax=Kutzneria sp. NPDC052558 TaxID=3364121 RepID=UPI0037CC7B6B